MAEKHKELLKKSCRICGCFNLKQSFNVVSYQNLLLETVHVDIAGDVEGIHAKKLCNKCRHSLQKKKSKACHEVPLYHFEEHSEDCTLCFKKIGRPSKIISKATSTSPQAGHIRNLASTFTSASEPPSSSQQSSSMQPPSSSQQSSSLQPPPSSQQSSSLQPPSSSQQSSLSLPSFFSGPSTSTRSSCATEFPPDRFVQSHLAELISCVICCKVTNTPLTGQCEHIYCVSCHREWFANANVCYKCKCVSLSAEYSPSSLISDIYASLKTRCSHSNKGCTHVCGAGEIGTHELNCSKQHARVIKRAKGSSPRVGWKSKSSLSTARKDYVRTKRLQPIIAEIDSFCNRKFESKTDVLFFLLADHLKCIKDDRYKQVENVWQNRISHLSAEACLALRVNTLQSKKQYRAQYNFFRKNTGDVILKPPGAVDNVEKTFVPGSTRYKIEGHSMSTDSYYHTPVKLNVDTLLVGDASFEPIMIGDELHNLHPEERLPECKAVRWPYPSALAQTLEELDPHLQEGLQRLGIDSSDSSLEFLAVVKDGADGMGDVSIHKEKSNIILPDKAFRASFAVVRIELVGAENIVVYEEEKPNSVRVNRPLLEGIGDENNAFTAAMLQTPIEDEREFLKNKILKVDVDGLWRKYRLRFFNSMIDEKLDRAESGLAGSGSKHLCTLCYATRETCKTDLGTFCITRNYKMTEDIANYVLINPDKLSKAELDNLSMGVKQRPLLKSDAAAKLLDATHADINMGQFLKKIIVREMAGVQKWEQTQDVKALIEHSERMFDLHVKEHIGLAPQLMMPGNYARQLFDLKNAAIILSLIKKTETRKKLASILCKFRVLRSVYRALSPLHTHAEEVAQYKEVAVQMGKELIEHFSYVPWPNYLHKIIEHPQEIIQSKDGPGSIGAISGEGNEAGNKLFRHFRKNLARKGKVMHGLRDVLWLHWLYSSPKLRQLANN